MKMLFMADLHCHNHEQFHTRLPNGRNSRLQDCLNILAQAKQVATHRGVNTVWILGDLFHARTKLDVDVFTSTWLAVKDLAEAVTVYILRGNHDSYSKIGEVHSLEAFKTIKNVHVIDEASKIIDCGVNVIADPYHPDPIAAYKPYWKGPEFDEIRFDLLLIHQAIREAAIGPYGLTGHGEVSVDDLPLHRCRYVFAGDYHKRQWFGPGDRVHYIGSPLQLNFGERDEVKAFTLLDTKTWECEEIPTNAPRFFQFDSLDAFSEAALSEIVRPDYDFVRVIVPDLGATEVQDRKATFDRVQMIENKPDKSAIQRVGQEVVGNDVALLEAYIAQRATDAFDHDRLLSTGIEELLGECA